MSVDETLLCSFQVSLPPLAAFYSNDTYILTFSSLQILKPAEKRRQGYGEFEFTDAADLAAANMVSFAGQAGGRPVTPPRKKKGGKVSDSSQIL